MSNTFFHPVDRDIESINEIESVTFFKMEDMGAFTRHYPQPVVSGWSMRRFEKLDLDIMIRGNFIADNELNSALSGSFLNSTGVHHRSSLDPKKAIKSK